MCIRDSTYNTHIETRIEDHDSGNNFLDGDIGRSKDQTLLDTRMGLEQIL